MHKQEEEKAAAEVYEEFLASFDEPAKHGKLFVRGTVINAGSGGRCIYLCILPLSLEQE